MKARLIVSIAAFAVAFSMFSAQAQNGKMYSYTDENGTVVFTDQRPPDPNVKAQPVPAGPPPQGGNPYAQADAPAAEPSAGQQRREEITQNRQQAREQQAQNEAQCAAWQSEVETLEPHRRHFYTNEQGETVRMDDVERANRVAELKRQIEANCR